MDKKEIISKIRRLTSCKMSIINKYYEECNGIYSDIVEKVKKYLEEEGVIVDLNKSDLQTACYIKDNRIIQYCSQTDFVLGNETLQKFIEKLSLEKEIYFDQEINSYISKDLRSELLSIRSTLGITESISITKIYNTEGCSKYLHNNFQRFNHFRQAVVIDADLENGKEICINALFFPHQNLKNLSEENSVRNDKKILFLLTDKEQQKDLLNINIIKL